MIREIQSLFFLKRTNKLLRLSKKKKNREMTNERDITKDNIKKYKGS